MAKLANDFAIGCDPEFVLLDNNGCIKSASGYMGHKGPIGWDHNGMVVELRPEQARGTYTVLRRLYALLHDIKLKEAKGFKWRAGAFIEDAHGNHYGLGGHLHFDIKGDVFGKDRVGALDATVKLLEELDILPTQECKLRRTKTGYGKFGEIRSDWPDKHVEYRSISSWLHNPWIAFLVLTTMKLAASAPELGLELKDKSSMVALKNFIERFASKDINADRLLHKLERPAWLKTPPDTDLKEAWKCSL